MHGIWLQWTGAYLMYLSVGAAAGTVRLRRHYLGLLARRRPHPGDVTGEDLVAFVMTPGWAAESRRSARSTVCGFYRWAVASGRLVRDPSMGLPKVKLPVRVPRPVPEDVYASALEHADGKERLMLLLAGRMGLRRAEIATVHTRDVVNGLLIVRGKGDKERVVPLSPQVATELARLPEGWVFPGAVDGHVSPDWVGRLLSRCLGAGWSGHGLRKRFATRAYGARDPFAVRDLLGHSRLETTRLYVGIPVESLRAAVLAAA